MLTVDIRTQLHDFINQVNDTLLKAIYLVLEEKIKISSDRISVEKYNQELNESEAEYKTGNFISHQEFLNEIKKW